MKMWLEVEIEVKYDYSPPAEQTRTDPFCPAELTVTATELGTYDISDMISTANKEEIMTACWEEEASKASGDNEP